MSISHLCSLRYKKRMERLEWLGDAVIEEAVFRLVARKALAVLDRAETGRGIGGSECGGIPESLHPSSDQLGSALRLAVSNENLEVVYQAQLAGLVEYLGLPGIDTEDHWDSTRGGAGVGASSSSRKRRRPFSLGDRGNSSSRCHGSPITVDRRRVVDKRRPDLVEAVIGEAFEASLNLKRQRRPRGGRWSAERHQRFAGVDRAELVDGLLSGVLGTDLFLSSLEPRVGGRKRTVVNVNVNRFSILECSDEEEGKDYDGDDSYGKGNANYQRRNPFSAAAVEAIEYDDDDNGNGNGNGFGGGELEASHSRASRGGDVLGGTRAAGTPVDADADASASDAGDHGGRSKNSVKVAAAAAATAEIDQEGGRGVPIDKGRGKGRGLGIGREEEGSRERKDDVAAGVIAAAREAVLRHYGAALIRFRVSVFLYCSSLAVAATASAAAAGGGGGGGTAEGRKERQAEGWENVGDPSELTMRRQNVLRSENLEAVAARLRRPLEDCCCRSGNHLNRYHHQQFMPPSVEEATATVTAVAEQIGPSEKNCVRIAVGRSSLCDGGDGDGGPRAEAYSVRVAAMLLASSGERDDGSLAYWHGSCSRGCRLGGDSTLASEAPSAFEAPFARDPWTETDLPRASAQAACIFATREESNVEDDAWKPVHPQGVGSSMQGGGGHGSEVSGGDDELRRANRGRKRKRCSGGGSDLGSDGSYLRPALPPHYAKWVGRLPRDSRGLLGRLGHHDYVKALEEILNRFLRSTEIFAAERIATKAFGAETVAVELPTAAPDIWRALLLRMPHPSLTGLVEPAELALVGAERVVLPMPNPFYRRIFHDLCRVHGFRSRGGVAVAVAGEKGGEGDGDGEGTAVQHRTVEVTRGFRVGGKDRGRVVVEKGIVGVVGPMVPVETLLGGDP